MNYKPLFNSNFHLIRRQSLLTNDFELTMPNLYHNYVFFVIFNNFFQFVDRMLLLFSPKKYQADLPYLRRVTMKKVNLFTLAQIICFIVLWVFKSVKAIALLFPLMVILIQLDLFCYVHRKRMIFEKCMEKLRRNVFLVFVFDLFLNFVIGYIFKILRAQIWVTLFHLQQILKQIF